MSYTLLDEDRQMRRRKRGFLRMYYGVNDKETTPSQILDPLDIDGAGFKVNEYVEKMLKELSLTDLYEKERRVKRGEIHVYDITGMIVSTCR